MNTTKGRIHYFLRCALLAWRFRNQTFSAHDIVYIAAVDFTYHKNRKAREIAHKILHRRYLREQEVDLLGMLRPCDIVNSPVGRMVLSVSLGRMFPVRPLP